MILWLLKVGRVMCDNISRNSEIREHFHVKPGSCLFRGVTGAPSNVHVVKPSLILL